MSILVGYVPTPVGEAAVRAAIEEARLRGERLLIVNSVREGALADKSVASDDDLRRRGERLVKSGYGDYLLSLLARRAGRADTPGS